VGDGGAARVHALVPGGADAVVFADREGFQIREREPGDVAADGNDGGVFFAELPDGSAGGSGESEGAAGLRPGDQCLWFCSTGAGAELCVRAGGSGGGGIWREFFSSSGDGDGGAAVSGEDGQGARIDWHRGKCGFFSGADLRRVAGGVAGAGTGRGGMAEARAGTGDNWLAGECRFRVGGGS